MYRLLVLLLLLIYPAVANGLPETSVHSYTIPNQGKLNLELPREWQEEVLSFDQYYRRIVFRPSTGKSFELYVTTFWPVPLERSTPSLELIRSWVNSGAIKAKANSVETELPLISLASKSVGGFYFSSTDKFSKPEKFKYMSQGAFITGDLWVSFTILTNDGQEQVVQKALHAMRSATQRRD